eukprot:CAMPEP_0113675596 /NCGR_PEP_ID=MMETSP0038_2-20120614/8115_1 /TAXON_ID=2898 /ORGANISM="Cryptomonas paramecium" /LENGTH=164 /DNA_ID=CAMNT_0000592411 /DNA_START=145 /DNA_END=639 /DNA_ORIENTATION=+ /assembly_acc=CAM_ASM_000170
MKSLVHSAADAKRVQQGLAQRLAGGRNLDGNQAKAVAAAAAEIAKILSAPSARDIVLGHAHVHRQQQLSAKTATWDSVTGNDDSTSDSHTSSSSNSANPTPWLKTPSEEGEFTYSHKKLARTFSMCSHRHSFSCNDEDTASQAHGWSTVPDRSVMGASTWRTQE